MSQKIYKILNKIYGIGMMISFFAGGIPLIPFIFAIIIGGDVGESISVFLYKSCYPWVIVLSSVSVLIGLIATYVGKRHDFSMKTLLNKKEDVSEKDERSNR